MLMKLLEHPGYEMKKMLPRYTLSIDANNHNFTQFKKSLKKSMSCFSVIIIIS